VPKILPAVLLALASISQLGVAQASIAARYDVSATVILSCRLEVAVPKAGTAVASKSSGSFSAACTRAGIASSNPSEMHVPLPAPRSDNAFGLSSHGATFAIADNEARALEESGQGTQHSSIRVAAREQVMVAEVMF
jgi:hypothetical protein